MKNAISNFKLSDLENFGLLLKELYNFSNIERFNFLRNINGSFDITVIIVTHNAAIAPMADKVIHFKNGTAESIEINQNPLPVEKIEW